MLSCCCKDQMSSGVLNRCKNPNYIYPHFYIDTGSSFCRWNWLDNHLEILPVLPSMGSWDTQRATKPLVPSHGYLREPPVSTGNSHGSQMAPKCFPGLQNKTSCNASSVVNVCCCSTDQSGCWTLYLYVLWSKCKLDFCKQKLGWCIQLYFFKATSNFKEKGINKKKCCTLHNRFFLPHLLALFSNTLVMGEDCSRPPASIIASCRMSVLDQGMLRNCSPIHGGDS